MPTWITDENGNRASVERWGSEEEARAALKTLKNCSRCTDCSGCTDCYDCSDCIDCPGCPGCSYCSRCTGCTNRIGENAAPLIPTIPNIDKAIYEAARQAGALNMGNSHTCGTTHCRAGWAVHLAGDAGYALERFHGPLLAGQLIYRESGSPINPCRFFDSDAVALEDMRKRAEG